MIFENSTKLIFQKWFFSTAMSPIPTWILTDNDTVSDHLKRCPYNVRNRHDGWKEKSEHWDSVLQDLVSRLRETKIKVK